VAWDRVAWRAAKLLFDFSNVLEKGTCLISTPNISIHVLNKIKQNVGHEMAGSYHAAGHAKRKQAWIMISNG